MRIQLKIIAAVILFFAANANAEDPANHWQVDMLEDPSGFESVSVLRQSSSTTIKDEYAKNDVRPRLEFRCTQSDPTIIVRVDWGRFISAFSTEVGFKIDDENLIWLKWKVDGSEKVTLSPSAEDTQRLIGLMTKGVALLIDVAPYSEGPVTAQFNLSGLDSALAMLADKCG